MGNCFLASFPIENAIIRPLPFQFHPGVLVSRLLRPMLGRQEAPPHVRYVEAVFDAYSVLYAFIVLECEREGTFARDF